MTSSRPVVEPGIVVMMSQPSSMNAWNCVIWSGTSPLASDCFHSESTPASMNSLARRSISFDSATRQGLPWNDSEWHIFQGPSSPDIRGNWAGTVAGVVHVQRRQLPRAALR